MLRLFTNCVEHHAREALQALKVYAALDRRTGEYISNVSIANAENRRSPQIELSTLQKG